MSNVLETTPLVTRPKKKSLWSRLKFRKRKLSRRVIELGALPDEDFPPNHVCNQKYSIITFLPLVLYQQFKFFLNLYFLVMATSQFFPAIRIGYLYTYWVPLGFVISVTVLRELIDDVRRYRRDKEVNTQRYERVVLEPEASGTSPARRMFRTESVTSAALRVGDIVMLHKGQRVPADMILLRTSESTGTVYIRTDQLDGETDWKLRIPLAATQKLSNDAQLLDTGLQLVAEKPQCDIHVFMGLCVRPCPELQDSVEVENTLWSDCVLASAQATGLVIYTGTETRSVMKNLVPRSKVGWLDLRVNNFTKLLFLSVIFISFLMIVLKGFQGPWYFFMFRFVLLLSYIIPISLRVNLEVGKAFYSWSIMRDSARGMAGTVMRSTTIPEELGRVQYLLADKTGTLTMNDMRFKRLCLGAASYHEGTFHEVESLVTQYVTGSAGAAAPQLEPVGADTPQEAAGVTPLAVWEAVLAVALTHNVTPVYDADARQRPVDGDVDADVDDNQSEMASSVASESRGGAVPQQQLCDYQAASPDEVALVKWTDMMGVSLYTRSLHHVSLKLRATNDIVNYTILQLFPFTSDTKTMAIIVEEEETGEITYYVKGADVALAPLVQGGWQGGRWLAGASASLAAEGLRTLVIAKKTLTRNEYHEFESMWREARCAGSVAERGARAAAALRVLQQRLRLLALTGVEDRLAADVPATLHALTAAGIKIWMLTGDKLETALCIARSLQLGGAGAGGGGAAGGGDAWSVAQGVATRAGAHRLLERLRALPPPVNLILDGDTLQTCLDKYEAEAVEVLEACGGVVVARCSPWQKARVVAVLRARRRCVAAVGDGGNDVAMIQDADVGVGIEGVEGRAASLAGDVSVRSFSALARLLLVHGRRSLMRSAALCLFIIHRGIIVSTMQAVFSCVFYYSSVSLYPSFLMVGYGTIYTMLPVISLVLDKDISSQLILSRPQCYAQVVQGKQISYKTFLVWTAISIYQGAVIIYGALFLFEEQLIHIVEISFSALLLTELLMVALCINTWHWLMLLAEGVSLLSYVATLLIFTSYFDGPFIATFDFWWKTSVITCVSCLPLYIVKYTRRKWRQRQYKNMLSS